MSLVFKLSRRLLAHKPKSAFKPSWSTPALSSGQQLDAGIAARQHASRKDLKKSKKPFANYFKTEFPFSPAFRSPLVDRSGNVSSYSVAKLMTDAKLSWESPWGRPAGGVSYHGKRQDVLERPEPQFGEDELDKVIEELLEIRFEWDKEDDLVATAIVPESLYSFTEHCAPYSARAAASADGNEAIFFSKMKDQNNHHNNNSNSSSDKEKGDEHSDYIMVDGVKVPTRRRYVRGRQKPEPAKSKWDFHGVESVPVLVLDAAKGPLLNSDNSEMLTLRWKAENRRATQVTALLQLRQKFMAASLVGLPSRSLQLLLKCMAAAEVEDPAMDVAIGIAISENYNRYEWTECLEILRALRRVAVLRSLPSLEGEEGGGLRELYEDPEMVSAMFSEYVGDVCPTLIEKVWSRLPEHSSRLLHYRYYLDWVDLLSLAVEVAGFDKLPSNLPNPVSDEQYASKYFFLRYTLNIEVDTIKALVQSFQKDGVNLSNGRTRLPPSSSSAHYVGEERELATRPLVLWECVSTLVRLLAESLGDLLDYVSRSLTKHAQLALEESERLMHEQQQKNKKNQENDEALQNSGKVDIDRYLDKLQLKRPHIVPSYQLIGRKRPKLIRLRLLPFESFPSITNCLPTPFAHITQKATESERQRHHKQRRTKWESDVELSELTIHHRRLLQSPFTTVLTHSPILGRQLERVSGALSWSEAIVRELHHLVEDLHPPSSSSSSSVDQMNHQEEVNLSEEGGTTTEASDHHHQNSGDEVQSRQLLAQEYAQAKIQASLDSIFQYIQWNTMERNLLEHVDKETRTLSATNTSTVAAAIGDETPLERTTTTTRGASSSQHDHEVSDEKDEEDGFAATTADENQTCTILLGLKEGVEKFQEAIAELLEVHESQFGTSVDVEATEEDGDNDE